MPRNIEIKARVRSLSKVRQLASELASKESSDEDVCTVIKQRDVFYHASSGRLKLRFLFDGRPSQLVAYQRSDQSGPKASDFLIAPVPEPEVMAQVLERSLGVLGEVKKTRYLYMVGQTRVHCDSVQGLGDFMELEVMMKEGQSNEEGVAIAEDLMSKLGVDKDDLISGAYMDLILAEKKEKNGN